MNLGDDMFLLVALAAVTVFAFVLPFCPVSFALHLSHKNWSVEVFANKKCTK